MGAEVDRLPLANRPTRVRPCARDHACGGDAMNELHLPWLELAILVPAVGALWVGRLRDPDVARRHSIAISILVFVCAVGAWQDFGSLGAFEAHDPWDALWQLA